MDIRSTEMTKYAANAMCAGHRLRLLLGKVWNKNIQNTRRKNFNWSQAWKRNCLAKPVISRYFNLDAIISVGYRVNSKRGVLFRIWAAQLLKEYLINGFAINQQRLQQQAEQLNELKKTIKILDSVLKLKELTNRESEGLLKIISITMHWWH